MLGPNEGWRDGKKLGPGFGAPRAARTETQETAAAAPRKVADTVSVMGIPEIELTPKVRAAIVTLMAEVESLRNEVEHTRERLRTLSGWPIRTRWRRSPTAAPSCAS